MTTPGLFFIARNIWHQSAPLPDSCAIFVNRVVQLDKQGKQNQHRRISDSSKSKTMKPKIQSGVNTSTSDIGNEKISVSESPTIPTFMEDRPRKPEGSPVKEIPDRIHVWYRKGKKIPEEDLTLADIIGSFDEEEPAIWSHAPFGRVVQNWYWILVNNKKVWTSIWLEFLQGSPQFGMRIVFLLFAMKDRD